MGLLTIIFVLGAVLRVALMYLRPPAKTRFRNPERGQLAVRIERAGDIVVVVTFVLMIRFGYTGSPGTLVRLIWLVLLLVGYGGYALAHYLASRVPLNGISLPGTRPTAPPAPPRREPSTRQTQGGRPPATGSSDPPPQGGRQQPPRRPSSAGTRPPRTGSAPPREGEPSGAGRSRSAQRPDDRPRSDQPSGRPRPTSEPTSPTSTRHREQREPVAPSGGRPPGLRRPNPIPPKPEPAPRSRGDKADHRAAPEDPTELGGLP